MAHNHNWYVIEVEPGKYSAFASVTAPEGFREVSRIFDETGLVKVFFEKVEDGQGEAAERPGAVG